MTLFITEKCVGCDMCLLECPNQAISMGIKFYKINPDQCNECVGFYDTPSCQKVCPIPNAILRFHKKEEPPL